MTEQELKAKLEKVVGLYYRPGSEGEKTASINAIHRLCKKYAIRLTDYISGLAGELATIDYRAVQDTKAEPKKKTNKKVSRRALIIRFAQENIWDTASLADYLTSFGYEDLKANKKAVAGTLYDMQKNKGWDVRRSDDGRICIV